MLRLLRLLGLMDSKLLDVRSEERFLRGHWPGAYNVPWEEMPQRGFELPPRSVAFTVCCEAEDYEEVSVWFQQRHKPWQVEVTVAQPPFLEQGESRRGFFLFEASPLVQETGLWYDVR